MNMYFSIIMRNKIVLSALCLLFYINQTLIAQTIRGEVVDKETKRPIENVSIENIHSSKSMITDSTGTFLISAAKGELIEFKKSGYKIERVRIPMGYLPAYFKIILQRGVANVPYVTHNNRYDYHDDSIRFYELYKHELEFPKLSGIEMIASPFSALSKKNREIWQFQEDYTYYEQEKYIDKTFNEALITKFTGLAGDSLRNYMRRNRPSFEQLKSMNDYSFYTYIKQSVYKYRHLTMPRGAQ